MKKIKIILTALVLILLAAAIFEFFRNAFYEKQVLKQIIKRLEADSRLAEVLVTNVGYDEQDKRLKTTIKFLEFNTAGEPLEPKYFSFYGKIIQFQSLVARFDDIHIRQADKLRGKSVYLFWKAFALDGANTREYEITPLNQIPEGYRVETAKNRFEKKIWERFWGHALDRQKAGSQGIKNAQIEAPGTMFVPGMLYTIRIEHDGGLRIDSSRLPEILKGEKIPG